MFFQFLLLVLGFALLVKGADWLVSGSSALAKKLNVSDLAIGLTIVAFGTSAPELVVSIVASDGGHNGIILGNVIGSNNFNLFFILGLAAIISPLMVQSSTVKIEIPLSLFAAGLLFIAGNDFLHDKAEISHTDGMFLIFMFLLFLIYVARQMKNDTSKAEIKQSYFSNFKITAFIVLGLGGLIGGGKLVVDNAVQIATTLGMSERMIGLTIIAAGTSLPELATSVVAAIKKNNDIAVGNIIGSNIFNIFLIVGVSSLISPIQYDKVFNKDLVLLGAGTLFLLIAMFTGGKKKLDRWEASILLIVFVAYTVFIATSDF
jgi:cation:H+ antiporter